MRQLFIALIIIANHANAQDFVKLSGNIQNRLSATIRVSYNDNVIAYYPKEYFARIDKNGNFSFTIPVPANSFTLAEIKHGNRLSDLLLQAGDSLVMRVNAPHFDSTIHFTGRGSERTNFVVQHTVEKGRMNQYSLKMKTALGKEPADFLNTIALDKKWELDFLDKNRKDLPLSFVTYWTAYYQYYNYFFMEQYPQMHELVKHKKYADTIPEINYLVSNEIPYAFNDTLLQVTPYLLYLTGVFDSKLKASGYGYTGRDQLKIQEVQDSVDALAGKLMPGKSAEYFLAQNIYARAKNQQIERTENQFSKFKERWPESAYFPVLQKQVLLSKSLSPGKPAPDLDIQTQGGIHTRLSELKGKVVYLEFWASWCKQCVGDMLSEQKIKDLVKDKPIAFVYVSIDNDTAKDNAIAQRYKIDGLFTHATGGWDAKEALLYGVQGLPAYFLIDEEGKFAIQNPPSPMQATQLILEVEKLLK